MKEFTREDWVMLDRAIERVEYSQDHSLFPDQDLDEKHLDKLRMKIGRILAREETK